MPTNTTFGHNLPVPADGDDVNDGASAIRDLGNAIDQLLPYHGSASGASTDSSGYVTITHGLGFTPSRVFVQASLSTPVSSAILALSVDSIGATTFRVRLVKFTVQAGANYYTTMTGVSAAYDFDWCAFR
jgi:hypothetical protein